MPRAAKCWPSSLISARAVSADAQSRPKGRIFHLFCFVGRGRDYSSDEKVSFLGEAATKQVPGIPKWAGISRSNHPRRRDDGRPPPPCCSLRSTVCTASAHHRSHSFSAGGEGVTSRHRPSLRRHFGGSHPVRSRNGDWFPLRHYNVRFWRRLCLVGLPW